MNLSRFYRDLSSVGARMDKATSAARGQLRNASDSSAELTFAGLAPRPARVDVKKQPEPPSTVPSRSGLPSEVAETPRLRTAGRAFNSQPSPQLGMWFQFSR